MADYDPSLDPLEPVPSKSPSATSQGHRGADEDDDYDPSTFAYDNTASKTDALASIHHQTGSEPPFKNPFTLDDTDGEEDGSSTDGKTPVKDEVENNTGEDVPLASEPLQDTASAVDANGLNGLTSSALLGDATAVAHSPIAAQPHSSEHTTPSSSLPHDAASSEQQGKQDENGQFPFASLSKKATPQPLEHGRTEPPAPTGTAAPTPAQSDTQRLPHDKVGELEDRIKEDPKADTNAWKALISHYREKGQLEQARSVYKRFFEVFPDAVSEIPTDFPHR